MKITFHTLGCKLNFAESSGIANAFRLSGHEVSEELSGAEVVVVNTCVVTDSAEKKCRASIRQLRRKHPNALMVVMGCFSQLNPEALAAMEEVDIVVGNEKKFDLPNIVNRYLAGDNTTIHNTKVSKLRTFTPGYSLIDRTRTFLKIQDGCNYHCSYCTIPAARGRSRSGTVKEITGMITHLDQQGVGEIVLTGVNIGDFGRPHGESLLLLLQQIKSLKIQSRIRIGSIEPDLLSDEIISLVAETPFLMPHFHIPLQAGSNSILKAMKRHYNTNQFADRVMKIKSLVPDAFIACDIITGFPGERDDDFHEGLSFLESLPLSDLHAFTFSERKNTPAASMEGKVPLSVRKDRTRACRELAVQKKRAFYQQHVGEIREVLFEANHHKSQMLGFTDNYIRVTLPCDTLRINRVTKVRLDKIQGGVIKCSLP